MLPSMTSVVSRVQRIHLVPVLNNTLALWVTIAKHCGATSAALFEGMLDKSWAEAWPGYTVLCNRVTF